jgi:hypothetical protein
VKAFICVVLMQHEVTHEHRILTELAVAESEADALIKATLLAHPSGHDKWSVLSKDVSEVDPEALERAAVEVLNYPPRG